MCDSVWDFKAEYQHVDRSTLPADVLDYFDAALPAAELFCHMQKLDEIVKQRAQSKSQTICGKLLVFMDIVVIQSERVTIKLIRTCTS